MRATKTTMIESMENTVSTIVQNVWNGIFRKGLEMNRGMSSIAVEAEVSPRAVYEALNTCTASHYVDSSADLIERLAEVLDISLYELFTGQLPPEMKEPRMARICRMLEGLDADDIHIARTYLENRINREKNTLSAK